MSRKNSRGYKNRDTNVAAALQKDQRLRIWIVGTPRAIEVCMERNDTPSDSIICPECGVGEIVMGDCTSCNARICSDCGEYPVCLESDELCAGCLESRDESHCSDEEFAAELDSARDDESNGTPPSAEDCGA
jgi:hypothetical protein